MTIDKMITSLKSILTCECQYELKNNDAELKELQPPGMNIKVTDVPKGGLVVKVPRGPHLGIVKKEKTKGYKKSCDYLILVPCNDHIDAYFIELKTTLNPNCQDVPEEGCNQILCTIPVLEYLISMVNIHHGKNEKVNQYYVVIGEKDSSKLDKQGVKSIRPKSVPYKRKKFKIIRSSSTVPFKHLK